MGIESGDLPNRAEANRDEAECQPMNDPLSPEWQKALGESADLAECLMRAYGPKPKEES